MVENTDPRILVIGLDKNPTDLIKSIIGENAETINNEYTWQLKNKYYTANVRLSEVQYKWNDVTSNEYPVLDQVEAVIVYFNSQHENAVNGLLNLEKYLKNYDAEIKLIVCDRFSEDVSEHNRISDWCTANHFEFIDLEFDESTIDTECDYGTYINDTHGIERIVEDLQVHVWSNAQMIGKNTHTPKNDEFGEEQLDEFCELYSQLSAIADGIGSLPRDQRLQSAEQVIKQFWCAMNGSDDEFSDNDVTADNN